MSDIRHNHGGKFERRAIDLPTGPVRYFIGGNGPPYLHMRGAGGLRISHALHELTKAYQVFMPIIPGFDDMAERWLRLIRDFVTASAKRSAA